MPPDTTTPILDPDGLLDGEESAREEIVLAGDGTDLGPYPPGTFRKIGRGMATLVALVVATYVVPGLSFARPWTPDDPVPFWNLVGRELLGEGEEDEAGEQQLAAAQAIAAEQAGEVDAPIVDPVVVAATDGHASYRAHPDDAEEVPRALELADPTALDPFFEQLARTEAGLAGEVTRVSHWGDSVIANDHVSSALREQMQRRFGDAGHGFHLVAKPNNNYRHQAVRFEEEGWQRCYIINRCRDDGRYGFGGTTAWSGGGARSRWETALKTPNGRKVSRWEIWYAAKPDGGDLKLKVDEGDATILSTEAEAPEDRWHTVQMEDGPHRLVMKAAGGGPARLYGVVLEREGPGVVWDGMAQLGAFTNRMLYFDPEHLRAQIDHRDPDLLVFEFGGNDLLLPEAKLARFKQDFAAVLKLFRGEDHPRACLVISPVDHGDRKAQRIASDPMVPRVTEAQREVALEQGCAFFDTLAAMGGEGSVARWRKSEPPLISGDLAHLNPPGQRVMGRMIYLALMQAYREYRARADAQGERGRDSG